MDEFDIPIFKKVYELYRVLYQYRGSVPRQDRYTLWQRCEDAALDVIESILLASQLSKQEKLPVLENASRKLNLLRVFLRLAQDIRVLDNKKYVHLQGLVDEVGRMLGGWIKQTKS